jgi:hypothetical protein
MFGHASPGVRTPSPASAARSSARARSGSGRRRIAARSSGETETSGARVPSRTSRTIASVWRASRSARSTIVLGFGVMMHEMSWPAAIRSSV